MIKEFYNNLIQLKNGKITFEDIKYKIFNRVYRIKFLRRMRRNFFPLQELICRPLALKDKGLYDRFISEYCKNSKTNSEIPNQPFQIDIGEYIAEYKGRIVGYAKLNKSENAVNEWEIISLMVLREFWGYGIGEKIMKTIIKDIVNPMGKRIIIGVDKFNYKAINLYSKLGFKQTKDVEEFDNNLNIIIMSLGL